MADLYGPLYNAVVNPVSEARAEYSKLLAELVQKRAPEFTERFNAPYNDHVGKQIFLVLAGDPAAQQNNDYRELADLFLDYMQMRSVENDPSMTYSEYEASPAKQYALSEGGAANFEAAREYNLARAMQHSGNHAAPGSGLADAVLAGIGSFFRDDMDMLADARSSFAKDPLDGRAKEALYWWRQGEQADPENPVWATGVAGAKLPEDSLSTFSGVINAMGRADNPVGYGFGALENFRTGPAQRTVQGIGKLAYDVGTGRGVTAEEYVPLAYDAITSYADLPAQQKIAHHTRRKTPLVPDSPEKAAQMKDLGRDLQASEEWNQGSIKAYSPYVFEALGQPRRYFTPTEDAAVTAASSIFLDPMSLLGGVSAATKAARSGAGPVRSIALGASEMTGPVDWATESVTTGLPMANAAAQESKLNPLKFSPEVYLDTSMGKQHIAADDPRYDMAYGERLRDERERRYKMRRFARDSE